MPPAVASIREPRRTYYLLSGVSTVCYQLVFTVSVVYMAVEVGLDPLQLVLVGTVLELACFVFEVPTGLLADLRSRRLSVVVGFALVGVGFVLQGAVPTFAALLLAQVVWALGYTFTSGAAQAWLVDELGPEASTDGTVDHVLTRTQQISLVAAFVGTGLVVSLLVSLVVNAVARRGMSVRPNVTLAVLAGIQAVGVAAVGLGAALPLVLGAVGRLVSVPAAIAVSAVITATTVVGYARLRGEKVELDEESVG